MKASKSIHRADARPAFLGSLDLVIAAGGSPGDHDESVPHEETTTTTTTTTERPVVQPQPKPQPQPQPPPARPQVQPVAQPTWRASAYYYYMPGCW
jgi:hypothetical protein